MENLIFKGNNTKPDINFSAESGILIIKGRSILEFAENIFEPMNKWVEEYSKSVNNKKITIEIALEYFNSSTAKALTRFFILTKELLSNNNLEVNYYYDDESILDYGHDFAEVTGMGFNFVEKKYH